MTEGVHRGADANDSMNREEIFASKVRSAGHLAGVFEFDGETGYFYLDDQRGKEGQMVLGGIHIVSTSPSMEERDVQVVWDTTERLVGLKIPDRVWAVFDTNTGARYGGDYRTNGVPRIPTEIVEALGLSSEPH